MAGQMPTFSDKLKERLRYFYAELKLVRLVHATPSYAEFSFAGVTEAFEVLHRDGQLKLRRVCNGQSIEPADRFVLNELSRDIFRAVAAGRKSAPRYRTFPSEPLKCGPKRSVIELAAARETRIYQEYLARECTTILPYFSLVRATGLDITIRIGNAERHFVAEWNRAIPTPSSTFMSFDNYAFASCVARDITRGIFNGYKNVQAGKTGDAAPKKPKVSPFQRELPLWS